MKALILAAGKGMRLYPATKKTPKPLMPIAGRETLCYIIDEVVNCGIQEIAIVTSKDNNKDILLFIKNNYPKNKIITIIQNKQLGVAHAVKISKEFISKDDFILYLGDNLFENGITKLVSIFKKKKKNILSLKSVEDPRRFGVATLDKEANLIDIIEKPKIPSSSYAVTGIYGFVNDIFKHLENIVMSERGEYEITDAIKCSLESGETVNSVIIKGWWVDTGNISDYLKANEYKLKLRKDKLEINSSKITNSIITQNCNISDFAAIKNSKIFDYSSVGKKAEIINSEITNTIILDNSLVQNYKLKNCILSKGTKLLNYDSNMKIIENKII